MVEGSVVSLQVELNIHALSKMPRRKSRRSKLQKDSREGGRVTKNTFNLFQMNYLNFPQKTNLDFRISD